MLLFYRPAVLTDDRVELFLEKLIRGLAAANVHYDAVEAALHESGFRDGLAGCRELRDEMAEPVNDFADILLAQLTADPEIRARARVLAREVFARLTHIPPDTHLTGTQVDALKECWRGDTHLGLEAYLPLHAHVATCGLCRSRLGGVHRAIF